MNKRLNNSALQERLLHRVEALIRTITRHGLVLGLLLLTAGGMLARAAYLQVFYKDVLQKKGDNIYLRAVETSAHRGMILDRNGEPLAVSSPVDSLWVDPEEFLKQRERWPVLAQLLGLKLDKLEAKLAGYEGSHFVYLRRHLPPHLAQQILQLKIPGLYSRREYRRYYPDGEVTSHLLGFTNIDDRGQEGLEKTFDSKLRGIPGRKRVIQDRLGRVVEELGMVQEPQPGQAVVLSIDRRLQYLAYQTLKAAVAENKANAGSAVIADVQTGEILAMVNQPAGNPNYLQQRRSELLRNRAITDVCEPGSTVKPFTVALGLESGKWSPNTLVNARGPLKIGRNFVRDVHNYGTLDVTRVLSKSSNVGTSKIALSMPAERLWQLYKDLGFGKPSSVGLFGEQSGALHHFSRWGGDFGHATQSFGYGFSVNMAQLAQSYIVLASDGIWRPLTILKRDQPLGPAEERRVLSVRTVRQIRMMLGQAVTKAGTGAKALVPGYQVAGKTGTAHKTVNGRYAKNRYFALFAGMVPASNPRLVMTIIIDEPKAGEYYGGVVAAPVFGKAMGGILRVLNITPDDMPSMKIAGTITAPRGTP